MADVKPGNIVYWDDKQQYPAVVMYVTIPKWSEDGTKYARIAHTSSMVSWMPLDKLTVAKDSRSRNRSEQCRLLLEFAGFNEAYHSTLMRHLGWK